MLASGGFDVVKWSSNNKNLLSTIPANKTLSLHIEFEGDFNVKILGLQWFATAIILIFKVNDFSSTFSKRNILSAVARIFDPFGLVSPMTISAKYYLKPYGH